MNCMPHNIQEKITRNIYNMPGWRTKRRIIVFESDDWGSIRMPDRNTYNILLSKGIRVDLCPYNKNDSLASESDLSALFEVLGDFKDIHGNYAVITANSVIVNPNFNKIRLSDFKEYHYELFTETLARYPKHSGSFNLWKEGIEKNLFHPQFHGREHLHVARWMRALRQNLPETRFAFDLNLFGLSTTITSESRKSYLAAFDIDDQENRDQYKRIISEGLQLFNKVFGYSSKSFIAPNYTWPSWLEDDLFNNGVRYIQGQRKQLSPDYKSNSIKRIPHFTGQRNNISQFYLVRNCRFEPSLDTGQDSLRNCLVQIQDAFRWNKPAIISTHRVNFIGSIVQLNRDTNLRLFRTLLMEIKNRWPDIEFMTTDALGDLICNDILHNEY